MDGWRDKWQQRGVKAEKKVVIDHDVPKMMY